MLVICDQSPAALFAALLTSANAETGSRWREITAFASRAIVIARAS